MSKALEGLQVHMRYQATKKSMEGDAALEMNRKLEKLVIAEEMLNEMSETGNAVDHVRSEVEVRHGIWEACKGQWRISSSVWKVLRM
jgi:uncharacterized cupin superfamily protein